MVKRFAAKQIYFLMMILSAKISSPEILYHSDQMGLFTNHAGIADWGPRLSCLRTFFYELVVLAGFLSFGVSCFFSGDLPAAVAASATGLTFPHVVAPPRAGI